MGRSGRAVRSGRARADHARISTDARTAKDGTATWSLKTLRAALQKHRRLTQAERRYDPDVLLESGYSWQQSRSWCETAQRCARENAEGYRDRSDTEPKKVNRASLSAGQGAEVPVWTKMKLDPINQAVFGTKLQVEVTRSNNRMNMCVMV